MGRKICLGCKEEKDFSLFVKNVRLKSGIGSRCKECHQNQSNEYYHRDESNLPNGRHRKLMKQYGISSMQYEEMLKNQDYKCAVCNKTEQENNQRLAVDHEHSTKKVRKLLCNSCNVALGLVNDNPAILTSLISYLKEHE
jgi:hypothetical protein